MTNNTGDWKFGPARPRRKSWRQRRWAAVIAICGVAVTTAVTAAATNVLNAGASGVAGLLQSDGDRLPFTIATTVNDPRDPQCQAYVIDRPPSEVPPPRLHHGQQVDDETWASSLGSNGVTREHVTMTLQGKSSAAVVLQHLDLRVVSRRPPPKTGNAYGVDEGCGGGLSPRLFGTCQVN